MSDLSSERKKNYRLSSRPRVHVWFFHHQLLITYSDIGWQLTFYYLTCHYIVMLLSVAKYLHIIVDLRLHMRL